MSKQLLAPSQVRDDYYYKVIQEGYTRSRTMTKSDSRNNLESTTPLSEALEARVDLAQSLLTPSRLTSDR